MNKAELVSAVATQLCKSRTETEAFVNTLLETIIKEVSSGNKVQLAGFGTFEKRERASRVGRNPQTGETITIPSLSFPGFKPGKNFKKSVNVQISVN